MHISPILALSLICCSATAAWAQLGAQSRLGLLGSGPRPRPATEEDLDDFVDVFLAAFSPGPVWQYIYIDDEKYHNYTRTCTRKVLQEQWQNLDDTTTVNVIAVPIDHDDKRSEGKVRLERVVSFAVWSWNEPEELATLPIVPTLHALRSKCSEQLDVNLTRAEDLGEKFARAQEPYLGSVAKRHMHLTLLATHPDWDGNGFGAAQLNVGMKNATLANVPITLEATPAGYPLYDSMGFSSIANLTVEMLDGLGTLWAEYMRWDAN